MSTARHWSLDALRANSAIRHPTLGLADRLCATAYPGRFYRYWFAFNALRDECNRIGRPLRVLEVGVGIGLMKAFTNGALHAITSEWDGLSRTFDAQALADLGYGTLRSIDLTQRSALKSVVDELGGPGRYDALVALHVLEHLHEPEDTLAALSDFVASGGIVVGGMPSTPAVVAPWWERRLRRRARPFGHVSAFSPARIARMARHAGLSLEWLRGGYFARLSGSRLENSALWTRANLAWGAAFPGWPGECNWVMRKDVGGEL